MNIYEPEELFIVEQPAWVLPETSSPVTSIDYSMDGALIAYSNQPGSVFISSVTDGEVKRKLEQTYTQQIMTKVKFHPSEDGILLASTRDGYIICYNIFKNDIVAMARHLGSNLLTMNIDSFGEIFAIGCADGSVRIYDIENLQRTKALVKLVARSASSQAVQIYDMCFHPVDSNIVIAAGWNDRVLFWDIRTGNVERSITGSHIRGTSLDAHDNQIFTGSARDKKQIEVWDFGTAKKIRDIAFNNEASKRECMINSLKVSKNGLDLFVGGSICNLTQGFEYSKGTYIGQTDIMNSAVVNVAASPFGSSFVSGTENGSLVCHMVRLNPA